MLRWHRNPSSHHRSDAVGLYRWDEGDGFYPDFIIAISGRDTPGHVALLEVKGGHLWGELKEVEKSDAIHPQYGRVYMIGRKRGEKDFKYLRRQHERLVEEGMFEIARMAWV